METLLSVDGSIRVGTVVGPIDTKPSLQPAWPGFRLQYSFEHGPTALCGPHTSCVIDSGVVVCDSGMMFVVSRGSSVDGVAVVAACDGRGADTVVKRGIGEEVETSNCSLILRASTRAWVVCTSSIIVLEPCCIPSAHLRPAGGYG